MHRVPQEARQGACLEGGEKEWKEARDQGGGMSRECGAVHPAKPQPA